MTVSTLTLSGLRRWHRAAPGPLLPGGTDALS